MKVAVASDHAGFPLKSGVVEHLTQRGVDFVDFGCFSEERVDYVDFGRKAVEAVLNGDCDRALLVCGTGIGMGIVANKFKGIRATPCVDEYMTDMSRRHNDSNCLTLGARILSPELATRIVDVWLDTPFEGGRHSDRLQKIAKIEEKNFK